MHEDELIETLFKPLATASGADGLADDAATFPGGSGDVVVTCDALTADVHFFAEDPPEAIAAKALRVNLSDLAAKGAEPFGYVLALALGPGTEAGWVRGFAQGLAADNRRYGVDLLGGDTLRAAAGGGTTIAVTAFGRTGEGAIVRRRSAAPGDIVLVTGAIGDAALGLAARLGRLPAALGPDHRAALDTRYLYPEPPVAAWRAVRDHARAAMDVSDGLVGDLAKLCRAAGVGAVIEADRVPFSPAVAAAIATDPRCRDVALTGGDDYEILATVDPAAVEAYQAACASLGVRATAIGTIVSEPGVRVLDAGQEVALADGRFQHF